MRMGRAGLLVDGTAEEHLRIGALDEIIFCSRQKASNQQAASERRAVKEDELHAELEQQGQRDGGARRRLSHLQQLADQRRAQLQQRVADLVVHLAQRQLKNLR